MDKVGEGWHVLAKEQQERWVCMYTGDKKGYCGEGAKWINSSWTLAYCQKHYEMDTSAEPPGQESRQEAAHKFDKDKPRWDLLPYDALAEVVRVLTMGMNKYGARNWEAGMSWSRPEAALMRHFQAHMERRDVDEESGLDPLAHLIAEALFLLAFQLRGSGTDDRPVFEASVKSTIRAVKKETK